MYVATFIIYCILIIFGTVHGLLLCYLDSTVNRIGLILFCFVYTMSRVRLNITSGTKGQFFLYEIHESTKCK